MSAVSINIQLPRMAASDEATIAARARKRDHALGLTCPFVDGSIGS